MIIQLEKENTLLKNAKKDNEEALRDQEEQKKQLEKALVFNFSNFRNTSRNVVKITTCFLKSRNLGAERILISYLINHNSATDESILRIRQLNTPRKSMTSSSESLNTPSPGMEDLKRKYDELLTKSRIDEARYHKTQIDVYP